MADTLLSIPSSGIAGTTAAQSYTEYTYSYTATQSETFLTFQFRQDPAYWALDDVTVSTAGSSQVLVNGGFESNLTGWTLIGQQGLSAAGRVRSGSAGTGTTNSHSGSKYFYDGAVGGVDGIYQAFSTTVGQQYTIDFWLANDGGGAALAQVQVGGNVYFSAAPTLALDASNDTGTVGDGITSVTQPIITGTGAVGDTITLYDGTTQIGTATVTTGGTWSIVPSPALADGTHQLTATDTNQYGTVSAASDPLALTIDSTAPAVTAALLNEAASTVSDSTLTGTGDPGAVVTISEGGVALGTATADANGVWTFAPDGLADGPHALIATETDAAGNTSSAQVSFTLNAAAPSDTLALSPSAIGVFRYFSTSDGTQFFTSSVSESKALAAARPDLTLEGVTMSALNPKTAQSDPDAAPIFRFFDTASGTHFYTASTQERDSIQVSRPDLVDEGVSFYEHVTAQAGDSAVYRFFDTTNGTHFYTQSATEQAAVVATRPDMTYEGISFYAPTIK